MASRRNAWFDPAFLRRAKMLSSSSYILSRVEGRLTKFRAFLWLQCTVNIGWLSSTHSPALKLLQRAMIGRHIWYWGRFGKWADCSFSTRWRFHGWGLVKSGDRPDLLGRYRVTFGKYRCFLSDLSTSFLWTVFYWEDWSLDWIKWVKLIWPKLAQSSTLCIGIVSRLRRGE